MSTFSKTTIALLLLAGGFIAAKTFGPPDLAKRIVDPWRIDPANQWGELRPAGADDHATERLAPLDAVEMPASLSSAYTQPRDAPAWYADRPAPASPSAAPNAWPATTPVQPLATAQSDWPPATAAVTPSTYEGRMVPLRAAPEASPVAPLQAWETAKQINEPVVEEPVGFLSPLGGEPSAGPAPAEYAPWGAASADTSVNSQFASSPADNWSRPVSTPVAPPAVWQEPDAGRMAPLPRGQFDPEEEAARHTHIVTDGDSLQRLAERYLGDATRSGEIFAKNRDVLTHPDLLPLGVELKLP